MNVAQRPCRDGRLMNQKPENIMRPFSPHIIPITPKKVLVCVTSPLLKVPAYLAKLAGRTIFYVLMHEIYYMGVVLSSVQLFKKWEINFDSENYSTITSVFLLVSEAQGVQPSAPNIIPMLSPPKHFFVRVEAPHYLSTAPQNGPAMKCKRNFSRSCSAFSWGI